MAIDLLKQRNENKKKKPEFLRSSYHKRPLLTRKWKKPRGIDNKVRLRLKGYCRSPRIGWGSPKAVKGLSTNGKKIIIITKIEQLTTMNSKKETAVLSRTLGERKRALMLKKAKELGIDVMNFKKPEDKLKKIEEEMALRKRIKQSKSTKKDVSKKDLEKKAQEKEKEAKQEKSDEEKKKEQEAEKQEVLKKGE